MAKKTYIAPAVLEQQEIVFETKISGNNGLHNGNDNGQGNHGGGPDLGTNPGKGNK
ncbi:hypothetical protein [Paenibacillus wynnii]|uniref:hypothetical protein n=1 Tax=Paenibacillus wynnii TaxID=268407 RepID=UPI00278D19E8|nr:hypothetical protein [Paenibacillus wynnii]MDQ0194676.1 hypothetical protein [Paenibacillus wynnii]